MGIEPTALTLTLTLTLTSTLLLREEELPFEVRGNWLQL